MLSEYQLKLNYNNAKKEFQTITDLINTAHQTSTTPSFEFLKHIDKQNRTRVWTEKREQK
jgi:hypothetical protein